MHDIAAPERPSVAVVGGGMTGIAAALELAKSGKCNVTLFEKESSLGGLSGAYTWTTVTWDRYYHVLLSSDRVMCDLVNDLGLGDRLFWRETKTGFYGSGRLVSLSSSIDFLTFPFMSLWQKIRMGLGILYSASIKNPTKLDRIYVREWLTRIFGRRVYEQIWDPLLRSKLGEARERASAAIIWATIKRLYGARDSFEKKEYMGHVRGGYAAVLAAARSRLAERSVDIRTNEPVKEICDNTAIPLLKTSRDSYRFDRVLLTVDSTTALSILGDPQGHNYWDRLRSVEYLGIACVLLILRKSLSPYYVINLLDKELPFTGIIEATNVVAPADVGGYHLVYLPKYHTADDPIVGESSEGVVARAVLALQRVFPGLTDSDIMHTNLSRARYVQPLQSINSLSQSTGFLTPIQNVYLVNTSMIRNSTLNNNAAVTLGRQAAQSIAETLA